MSKLIRLKKETLSSRAKQLRNLCDDYIKNNSDEFYSEKEKVLNICITASDFLKLARSLILANHLKKIK